MNKQRLAERYLEFYKRANDDKNSKKLPKLWKDFDRYWEGEVNRPQSESDPGSCVNIIHPNVEGQVAMLTEQNIAVNPQPVTPSDIPFAETVRMVLEFIKDKNRLIRKLDVHERRREKYGTGILRVIYDPDALGGVGMPVIDVCNPSNIFVDPCITDIYKIDEAEFIIETVIKSVNWARRQFGSIAEMIEPNHFPCGEDAPSGKSEKYLHMLVWTRQGGRLRLVQMSGCGVILSDSEESGEGFYPSAKYPYFFTPLYFREGSIWGKGDVELLIPVQDVINDLDDQIRRCARLTGNPQRLIETGSGIDLDALTNEAGLNIPTNSVNSVRTLTPPELPSYVINRRLMAFQAEGQRVTRFSDQMTGTKQAGVDTATEALALQQAGTTGINHKKILLQETLSELFTYCLELVREFWTEQVAIKVTDKPDEFIFFSGGELRDIPVLVPANADYRLKFSSLNPDREVPAFMQMGRAVKDAEFDIKVTVGAGMPTNKAFVYQMMLECTKGGLIAPEEMREWLCENMGLPVSAEQPKPEAAEMLLPAMGSDIEGTGRGGAPLTGGVI